ncbi:hypothetical protein [Candidatus Sororendozoicomonas aggregata]
MTFKTASQIWKTKAAILAVLSPVGWDESGQMGFYYKAIGMKSP